MKHNSLNKNKILIVNDAIAVSAYIEVILNSAGYATEKAANGVEALEILNQTQFQLIITDLNMPEMDGFELTRQVRQDTRYRFVPVIFLTGEDKSGVQQKALEVGSSALLSFPFQKTTLFKLIRTLIR
ncbi:MAG: response regulator [Bacteroidetes bacterium]|nr:response regulator [Bacteroidota bacterium]